MANEKTDLNFDDGQDHSALLDMAFADANSGRYMRIAACIGLYFVLALIWMPGFSLSGDQVYDVKKNDNKPQKRKVLKPPPEKPLEQVITKDVQTKKKAPMPDLTPDEPEPVVEPDPPPEPEVYASDDWEIGIPDGPPEPPQQQEDSVARVGQVGVESPVFTKKVSPAYPERAIKIRLQGYVILEAILRKDGTVDEIKVLRGLGKGKFGFEEAAENALKKWEFLPGKVNGKPADVRMTLKVDFALQ